MQQKTSLKNTVRSLTWIVEAGCPAQTPAGPPINGNGKMKNNSYEEEQDNHLGGTLSLYSTEVCLLDLKKRVKEVREKNKELEERRKSATLEKETKYAKAIEVYESFNKQLEEPIPGTLSLLLALK